eukprot:g18092.t1
MLPKVSAGGKAPEPEKFILSCVKHLEAVTGKILQLKKVCSVRRILLFIKTAVMVEDALVCRNYWTTTHAKHYRVRRQKPPHPTQLVWWWSLVIFSVGCLTVFVLNRNMKTRADFARLRGTR